MKKQRYIDYFKKSQKIIFESSTIELYVLIINRFEIYEKL